MKKPKVVGVTTDKAMQTKDGEMTEEDKSVMGLDPDAEFIEVTSAEQLMDIVKAVGAKADEFKEQVGGKGLTQEQADFIRNLRVEVGCTWRAVAAHCHAQKGFVEALGDWAPPSNQLMGIELCKTAAAMFGEDPNADPWN